MRLSTELGAVKLDDNTYNSDHVEYRGQLAETTLIILDVLKYKFLQSKGCHKESFNEKLIERISQEMSKSCSNPCFSDWSFGKKLNKWKDKFPACKTDKDKKCLYKAAENVKNVHNTKKPMKECTKLQYFGVKNRFVDDQKSNEAIYQVVFSSPPKVSVKEEYCRPCKRKSELP